MVNKTPRVTASGLFKVTALKRLMKGATIRTTFRTATSLYKAFYKQNHYRNLSFEGNIQ